MFLQKKSGQLGVLSVSMVFTENPFGFSPDAFPYGGCRLGWHWGHDFGHHHLGVFINGGIPTMVGLSWKIMTNPHRKWMIWEYPHDPRKPPTRKLPQISHSVAVTTISQVTPRCLQGFQGAIEVVERYHLRIRNTGAGVMVKTVRTQPRTLLHTYNRHDHDDDDHHHHHHIITSSHHDHHHIKIPHPLWTICWLG